MKKYILLTIFSIGLLSCKGTKSTTSIDESNNSVPAVSEVEKIERKDTSKARTTIEGNDNVPGGVVSQTNGSTGGMDNIRMSEASDSSVSDSDLTSMYGALQMTDAQINTFNSAMTDYKESVISNPNGERLGTKGNEQELQLKKILTETQWNKYQAWKKKRK